MATNEDSLKKVTGEISEELPEAAYRLAATALLASVRSHFIDQIDERKDEQARKFFRGDVGQVLLHESVFGFGLAAALELLPGEALHAERRRLAFNLRVQAYEAVGKQLLILSGVLDAEVLAALRGSAAALPKAPGAPSSGSAPKP